MKYLKLFEDRKYQYLNKEHSDKLEKFVREFVDKIDINAEIDKLTLRDFKDSEFVYYEIFSDILAQHKIYSLVDVFILDCTINSKLLNKIPIQIKPTTPAVRNSLFDIVDKIYKEIDIKSKINKKLIDLLEKKPENYDNFYEHYGTYLKKNVKDACNWMLSYKKYNL